LDTLLLVLSVIGFFVFGGFVLLDFLWSRGGDAFDERPPRR
jgi:hypothetical protein